MITALSDDHEGVRSRAASAIAKLWTASTIDIVVQILGNEDAKTRNAAFDALVKIGPRGVPEMERALAEAAPRIKAVGREAIGKILLNEHVMKKIGALASHEITLGNPDVVVALLGAGVDRSVPDIENALIEEVNYVQDSGEPHISATPCPHDSSSGGQAVT